VTFADLTFLDQYRAAPLPAGYPSNIRTLYSPVDQVHAAELALISSTAASLDLAMYGFDDQEIADAIHDMLKNPAIAVRLTLDSSQAGGVHERKILAAENYPNSVIAVGRSERGAIMHLKSYVVDGVIRCSGSTNQSAGGEGLQDNELTVVHDETVALEASRRIGEIHAWMLAHPHVPGQRGAA
jgi:phosphatidylserine/phosphatidylglycerophosphate/cardiolipin synthase-like enzyme